MFEELFRGITATVNQQSIAATVSASRQPCTASVSVPQPSPLALEGDMEANFEFFEKSWRDYEKAIGIDRWSATDDPQKVSFLLAVFGEPARKKYFNFELTTNEQANLEAALLAIKQKVVAKRNIIIDRLDFFSAAQLSRETIDDFVSRLKTLAKIAKLGALETELITFKLVTADKWLHLRTKMLTIYDIDSSKAVDMCRAEEIAANRSLELGMPNADAEVKKIQKAKTKLPRCKFCGDQHEFAKGVCPAFGKRCHRCNGKNHFEKVCKINKKSRKQKPRRVKKINEKTSESEEDSSVNRRMNRRMDSDHEYEIGKFFDSTSKGGGVSAQLDLKFAGAWQSVVCELDTGANTSLIGHAYLSKLIRNENPPQLPSEFRLQSFGGNPIKVLGQVKIPCRRMGKEYSLVLQVVDVDHRPLLSAKVSRVLGLVKFCKAVSLSEPKSSTSYSNLLNVYRIEAQQIVEAHKGLFVGYGKLAGKVSLECDKSISPLIQQPRRVPIALRVEEGEFKSVKELVSDIGTLRYYNMNLPITIECDASCFGLGAAVYQQDGVIGYASRTLTATEKSYAQIEKELLAILFACIRFDQLVVGNPKVTIKTDHRPLINIFQKPLLSAPRRLQHMLLNLQRYTLTLEYVTGKDNVVADALSRAPLHDDITVDAYKKSNIYKVFEDLGNVKLSNCLSISDTRLSEIMQATAKDSTMQLIIEYILNGWPTTADQVPDSVKIYFRNSQELSTQDGLIFRNDRILVPQPLRRKLIDICHASHNGIEATLKLARANVFWPGMSAQIKEAIQSCATCAKFAASQSNPPMMTHGIPVYPFQFVSMDVFFSDYQGTKRAFLVTVDHYSDYFEVNILKDLKLESVIAACKENFARHGKPQIILTDNGTNFVCRKMEEFAIEWDFQHTT
ncbi:uncharacterized protein LOC129726612 [Wyeomyia smithii]|uniref:uncharacterized protein LOC129726612 n=1 Tax=Wyeomyia smithii TaxID=174621 RepID=UPI002467DA2D|nr:uncharacterized protein LOC129726612 [Wyeomyia smithii]